MVAACHHATLNKCGALPPTTFINPQKRPVTTAHPLLFPSTLPITKEIFFKREGVTRDVTFERRARVLAGRRVAMSLPARTRARRQAPLVALNSQTPSEQPLSLQTRKLTKKYGN